MPISAPRMVASTMPITATCSGIQHTDQQRPAIGVHRRVVRQQRLADRNAGDPAQEAEPGGDPPRRQVLAGIADQVPDQRNHHADDHAPAKRPSGTPGRTRTGGIAASARRAPASAEDRRWFRTSGDGLPRARGSGLKRVQTAGDGAVTTRHERQRPSEKAISGPDALQPSQPCSLPSLRQNRPEDQFTLLPSAPGCHPRRPVPGRPAVGPRPGDRRATAW